MHNSLFRTLDEFDGSPIRGLLGLVLWTIPDGTYNISDVLDLLNE